MHHRKSIARTLVSVAFCSVLANTPSLRAAPIYGGPTHDTTTGTGYTTPILPVAPGATAGNGTAAGTVTKVATSVSRGLRAVRWNGTSATELGLLELDFDGVTSASQAFAINATGTAVGYSNKFTTGSGERAVRWDAGSNVAVELGNLATVTSFASRAYAINSSGTITGFSSKADGLGNRAVRWAAGSTVPIELGNLGTNTSGNTNTLGLSINSLGSVAGSARKYEAGGLLDRGTRAVRWDHTGTVATELNVFSTNSSGVSNDSASAINTAGTAVGSGIRYSGNTSLGFRAVRWAATGTAATELGHLGTNSTGNTNSVAYTINEAGTAVGFATKWSGDTNIGNRAVRWDATGTAATELGNLGTSPTGVTGTFVVAINNPGVSVGSANKYAAGTLIGERAAVWGADGVAIDLNTLLTPADATAWTLLRARSLSDTWWATGIGKYDPDGVGPLVAYDRLFLLDLVSQFGRQGDANRDNAVSFDDLLTLAQHYGQSTGARWDDGDFTGNGSVDFGDLLALAQNYGTSGLQADGSMTADFASAWVLSQSIVPEPSVVFVGFAALTGLRRRR